MSGRVHTFICAGGGGEDAVAVEEDAGSAEAFEIEVEAGVGFGALTCTETLDEAPGAIDLVLNSHLYISLGCKFFQTFQRK
jgi:hypothetical protein